MKSVRIVCLAALGLMLATTAQANNNASSGVIHFVGQIVEGSCGTKLQQTQVQISCYRNGANHLQHVALNPNASPLTMQKLGTIAQRAIPGHPELREMTITYF